MKRLIAIAVLLFSVLAVSNADAFNHRRVIVRRNVVVSRGLPVVVSPVFVPRRVIVQRLGYGVQSFGVQRFHGGCGTLLIR